MPLGIPSLRGVLKWPPTATLIIATSGLVIAVVAVSRRIWRGGGKKAIDPDGKSSIKSQENINSEYKTTNTDKKSSDGISTPEKLKGEEILKPKEKPETQTVVDVTSKNKAGGFVEKPHSLCEVEKETGNAVSAEIRSIVFAENPKSQPKSAEEENSEVTFVKKSNLSEGKPLVQSLVPEDKPEAENKEKTAISAENPESQPEALKGIGLEATSVKEPVISGEKTGAQHEEVVTLESKETTISIPTEGGDSFFNEVHETVTKRSPNSKAVVEIETLKRTLCSRIEDQILENKVDNTNNSVCGANEECASPIETQLTSTDSKQNKPPQSSGKRDNCSDFSINSEPRKEQSEELCHRENPVSLSEFILEKPSSEPLQAAVIKCPETLRKSSETESKLANGPVHDSQILKSSSVAPPKDEVTVKGVNSVIRDSVEQLVVQVVSLDSVNCADQKLKHCASPDTVKEPVKEINPGDSGLGKSVKAQFCESYSNINIDSLPEGSLTLSLKDKLVSEKLDSVISEAGKLEINSLKSRSNLESDDTQLIEDPVEVPPLVESQSGELQHIPFNSSGQPESAKEQLKGISHTFPETKRSVVALPEGGEVKESIQVTLGGAIPQDSGEASLKEGLTLKEREVGGVIKAGEEEKVELREVIGSGSCALGDQLEGGVTVLPVCTPGAKLTEGEVNVSPVVKDLSETLERINNKLDRTQPSEGVVEESTNSELVSSQLEDSGLLTKGVENNSDMVQKGKSGKRKGKKGKKVLHEEEEEVVKMVKKMELNDIVRETEEESILQNGDVGEDHSGKSSQVHASGVSSPSIPNFPDNRSEGSSCGDSGKGRSDVTTPGGLEEDLREVSFSHHFSPPCSTSGPEEEEEDRVRRASGSTVEDGSRGESVSAIVTEDIIGASPVVVGSDGLVMPVALPVYPGMVPMTPPPSVYEFVIPQGLVGRLIGKHGSFVNLIKARTSATIFIKTHPETNKLKVCAIEGTDEEIQAALDMIREKFPLRRYSSMTLEQVFFLPLPPPTFTLIPDSLPLQLVEGVSNDVILSALVSPSHYFLQQPTHPTYPTLAKLDMWMAMCYQDANAPMLPEDVKAGIICAAPTMGGWYRAQIVAVEEIPSPPEDESAEEGELIKLCDVRFVDYGGYERLPSHSLRQIRSDFMTLPFQASECYLASVVPAPTSDENKMADEWSLGAYAVVEELTQAQVLKAQVVGHAPDGLPFVLLYAFSHSYGQVVQVNEELVNRGLALWTMPVVDTDEALLTNGTENVSEVENPAEDQPEAIAA